MDLSLIFNLYTLIKNKMYMKNDVTFDMGL